MSIRLIALDMDGTLLTSEKTLSEENKRALEKCIEKGIYIVPATGRTTVGIPDFVKNIPGVRYGITTNGAVLADMETGETLDERLLSPEQVIRILELLDRHNAMYDPYIKGRGISEERFYDHMEKYGLYGPMKELVKQTRDVVPNIIEYVKERQLPAEKVNSFFGDLEEREIVKKELEQLPGIIVTAALAFNLEINSEDATKGKGLLRLAEYLGIKQEETMAFGDGGNDISMLQAAGIGVAMGNASESVKESADYVTSGNDESGVAAAICHFLDISI